MSSEPADTSTIEWWLNYHSQSQIDAHVADTLYLAISDIDGGATDPRSEYQRLGAVRAWLESSIIDTWLSELINKRSGKDHPRVQLISLLRSDLPELQAMSKVMLNNWVMISPSGITEEEDYLTSQDAITSLGIGKDQFQYFMKYHLLDFQDGRQRRPGQVSRLAVNNLLFVFQKASNDLTEKEGRPPTCSLAETIKDVLIGKRKGAGYTIADGLNTLMFEPQPYENIHDGVDSDWLDVKQIAGMLFTFEDAVRSLCSKGWIPYKKRNLRGESKLIASRKAVEEFNLKYILSGEIASKINISKISLAGKLIALGLKPVAGPKNDGTLLHLFKRDDFAKINLDALRNLKNYKTKKGDKAKSVQEVETEQGKPTLIKCSEAAKILCLRIHDIHILIRRGVLESSPVTNVAIHVERQSVLDFKKMINRSDMVNIEEAASRLNISRRTLDSVWVNSGVIEVHDFGLWRKVYVHDLEKLEQLRLKYVTAKEAGHILSEGRHFLYDREAGGVITSVQVGTKRKIRLYARSDVERLMSETPKFQSRRSAKNLKH